MKTKRLPNTELKLLENNTLHFPYLTLFVCVICDINKVANLWTVHLLVLAGQKHSTNTN